MRRVVFCVGRRLHSAENKDEKKTAPARLLQEVRPPRSGDQYPRPYEVCSEFEARRRRFARSEKRRFAIENVKQLLVIAPERLPVVVTGRWLSAVGYA